ncbi:MAG: hypothetical protein MZV70_40155 [Desulfobacterales bacterium]|nr:hypothetical protein [Desulfobacterales bacterium]
MIGPGPLGARQPHFAPRTIASSRRTPLGRAPWQERLAEVDAVVNLAGRSIFGRWTEAVKTEIRESRILTTRHVVQGLPSGKPVVLISASGVGYYGSRGDDVLTEDAPAGDDFLAGLSVDWEREALAAAAKGRAGGPDAPGGGAGQGRRRHGPDDPGLQILRGRADRKRPAVVSRGSTCEDLSAAMLFLLEHPEISGPVNLCAPEPGHQPRSRRRPSARALNRPACHARAGLHGPHGARGVRRRAARQPAGGPAKAAAAPFWFPAIRISSPPCSAVRAKRLNRMGIGRAGSQR